MVNEYVLLLRGMHCCVMGNTAANRLLLFISAGTIQGSVTFLVSVFCKRALLVNSDM
jgi:hypothetical protein